MLLGDDRWICYIILLTQSGLCSTLIVPLKGAESKMTFTLTIELGNDAMQTRRDIESALRKIGQLKYMSDPPAEGDDGKIMDENGNTVGKWEVTA